MVLDQKAWSEMQVWQETGEMPKWLRICTVHPEHLLNMGFPLFVIARCKDEAMSLCEMEVFCSPDSIR